MSLDRVRHDYLRYANCWEDADLLLEALRVQPGQRVLSIGSAGDNSFSLLTGDPAQVVAVDINRVQLYLIELKKAAYRTLDYDDWLAFLGFRECEDRRGLYKQVESVLPYGAAVYWSDRMDDIDAGVVHTGKFERYFAHFRRWVLPLVHTQREVAALLAPKSAEAQAEYFSRHWNTWRWRTLFRAFFSRRVMGWLGRDPAFLKEVDFSVSRFILSRAAAHLSDPACQRNYFLRYIFTGEWGDALPHYARRAHYETIRSRVDRLVTFEGLAEAAHAEYGAFDGFNLSNIFEYMPQAVYEAVSHQLAEYGRPGARYAYWNLMVPRRMAEATPQLRTDAKHSEALTGRDKGFFYRGMWVEEKS